MAYCNPTASVVTNQDRSHTFHLRGTHQWCPPLNISFCMSNLATSVRESAFLKQISIDGVDYKIMYADDIPVF